MEFNQYFNFCKTFFLFFCFSYISIHFLLKYRMWLCLTPPTAGNWLDGTGHFCSAPFQLIAGWLRTPRTLSSLADAAAISCRTQAWEAAAGEEAPLLSSIWRRRLVTQRPAGGRNERPLNWEEGGVRRQRAKAAGASWYNHTGRRVPSWTVGSNHSKRKKSKCCFHVCQVLIEFFYSFLFLPCNTVIPSRSACGARYAEINFTLHQLFF